MASLNLQSFSQSTPSFSYSDSTFHIGSTKIIPIVYGMDGQAMTDEVNIVNKPVFNSLTTFLRKHPNLIIEFGIHTHCRGHERYNLKLSEKRASQAKAYLVNVLKVNANQIIPKGYGESSPLIICECSRCSENQHLVNQRTEIKILSIQ